MGKGRCPPSDFASRSRSPSWRICASAPPARAGPTRFPARWRYGASTESLRELLAYWGDGFDWRAGTGS
ncbi:MAG: epoxide hydrolase N-terminal domain-containing protein [Thermoanaerobaculia bacterium]|nr:epoxide hydrolase N-terminal domain-containing protein [Acidobacteriota bacterium]